MRSSASSAFTILGILAIIAASFLVSIFGSDVIYGDIAEIAFIGGFPMLLVVAVALIPATQEAFGRRRKMHSIMARELTKLRRVYHLSRHLAESSTQFRAWFTELHAGLVGYLEFFSKNKKANYADSDSAFRRVSYQIYGIPDFQTKKEETLYAELLDTIADVAEARQQLKSLWLQPFGGAERVMLALFVALSAIFALLGSAESNDAFVVSGSLAMMMWLLWRIFAHADALSEEASTLAGVYTANISKLEFRHREDE